MELWIECVLTGPETHFTRISNIQEMCFGLNDAKTSVDLFVWTGSEENSASGLMSYSLEHLDVTADGFLYACSQVLSEALRTATERGQHALFLNEDTFVKQALTRYPQVLAEWEAEAEAEAEAVQPELEHVDLNNEQFS